MQTCKVGGIHIGGGEPVRLMGVINCSPESFFSRSYVRESEILRRAEEMIDAGADIIDLGARSTAPGSVPISVEEEIRRICGALEALKGSGIPVSVDTRHTGVLEACLDFEIAAINDINGLADEQYAAMAGESGLPVFAMASFRQPGDPVGLEASLQAMREVLARAERHGIKELVLDPGIGRWTESRRAEDDWELCRNFSRFLAFERPLLAAVSRKSFIGELLERPADERLAGSLAVTFSLLRQGASVIRTHDIKETKDLITVFEKLGGST